MTCYIAVNFTKSFPENVLSITCDKTAMRDFIRLLPIEERQTVSVYEFHDGDVTCIFNGDKYDPIYDLIN